MDKATTFTDAERWTTFNIFPNMEEFVDMVAIHLFLTQNHVPTILADPYYYIHVRTQNKKGTITCCIDGLFCIYQ